jgi:hypothetical protein
VEFVLVHHSIEHQLSEWESDDSLFASHQLERRLQALDRLDAFSPDCAELASGSDTELHRRAQNLTARLEAANAALYQSIRDEIRRGTCPGLFADRLEQAQRVAGSSDVARGSGYDELDVLVSGVFAFDEPVGEPMHSGPERVFYQPTPARHIFALMAEAHIAPNDVLFDLGSGLGHVPLLVSASTGARCVGVELEPSLVASARRCAQKLNLQRVSLLEQDAQHADLSSGTVFYLYTPFTGSILRAVLDGLKVQAAQRAIKVCTFGPCVDVVRGESWLEPVTAPRPDRITLFVSRAWRSS